MSLPKDLYGSSRPLPQSGERNWGNVMTQWCSDITDGLDGITLLLATGVSLLKLESTDTDLVASATLTPTHPVHRIKGDDGGGTPTNVTLDTTTAIADGSIDGQLLILIGVNDSGLVTIDDAANTGLNGQVILGSNEIIFLYWDATNSLWRELGRNN